MKSDCTFGPAEWTEFETVGVDRQGKIVKRELSKARQVTVRLENDVLLEMVEIPGGTYPMGSPDGFGYDDEHPQHEVSVRPFLMGRCEVTQEQWGAVMGWMPPCRFKDAKLPVERVSWNEATEYCGKLSERVGGVYRLPSEAEREYACRAGTTTPFHYGETITTDLTNYVGEHTYRAEPEGVYRHVTTEAGSFPPYPLGLWDMHGNVWEWCADAWHDDYQGAPSDGSVWAAESSAFRVLRGGPWHEPPGICRSAIRLKFNPTEGEEYIGFRVVTSLC